MEFVLVKHQSAIPGLSTHGIFRKYPTARSDFQSRRTIDSILETTPPEILVPQSFKSLIFGRSRSLLLKACFMLETGGRIHGTGIFT